MKGKISVILAILLIAVSTLSCRSGDPKLHKFPSQTFAQLNAATEEPGSLRVIDLSPPDGASNIPLPTPIDITFSSNMDYHAGWVGYIKMDPDTGFFIDHENNYIELVPRGEAWLPGTKYTVTFYKGMKSRTGKVLEEDFSFSFTTKDLENTPAKNEENVFTKQ